MNAVTRAFGRRRRRTERGEATPTVAQRAETLAVEAPPVDIAPNDPIIAYFQSVSGAVDIDSLDLDSPGAEALRVAGIKLVVPLVTQGELIGLLNLGPRRSEQEYSADDRKLLANLASQAAPAVRVGQLVREQEAEVRNRERLEQELRVAQLIQQQFLPKELPELGGWQVSAYYRPAREVGGDFYDFIELADGRVGIVAGDVTDKGVPAALVMATTRSILRGEAAREISPGRVLTRANDLLVPDIPSAMFVTCLYGVLDPATGHFVYANAGHNLPYVATEGTVTELRARGMPLGLMPGMDYEEKEATLEPGQIMLLHSDGLAEAHNEEREMFGFPRVSSIMGAAEGGKVIDELLTELDRFTGPGSEQEDDITLVTLGRSSSAGYQPLAADGGADNTLVEDEDSRVLAQFTLQSVPGNERIAMEQVAAAVADLDLSPRRLERLRTAVAEATMNAIEHGNDNQAELQVSVQVLASEEVLRIHITDQGGNRDIPEPETPDIEAKLAGEQKARGWGLFLIRNMVDDMQLLGDDRHHTIELTLYLKGDDDVAQ
jgi:serine phosphatase RsbU (regulator of sigma subunit)/anti-sigma regulatory factor (Ser/Thr protein kinase)